MATSTHNPKNFYDNIVDGKDLQRAYLFKVLITIQGNNTKEFFIRSSTLPTETVEAIIVPRLNSEVKYAGKVKYNDWSVDVIDNTNMDNFKIFRDYQNKVYDSKSGKLSQKDKYIGRATVELLNGSIEKTYSYILKNLWISSLEPPQVVYGSSDLFKFKAVLKYDIFETK